MDIYGEQSFKSIEQNIESVNTTDTIIYIDPDKDLTTMDCILLVKKVIDEVPKDIDPPVALYVIKGMEKQSLRDSGRTYDIIYRGHIYDIDFLMAFDLDFINVFLSESNSSIPMLRAKNYKFELI